MLGWNSLVESLKAEKIKFFWTLPAGAGELFEELYDTPEIKVISVRKETSAVYMAMAESRLTGQPSVCWGTQSGGTGYMLPGFLEAYVTCTPVIQPSKTIDTTVDGKGGEGEFDMVHNYMAMTKWSVKVPRADRIPWYMNRAFTIATNGKPGPVFVEIPGDLGDEDVADMPKYVPSKRSLRSTGDPELISQAIKMILAAERPVILAGGGVVWSRASHDLIKFAEALGIPILTTASGRGSIPEDHPLSIGLVGWYRTDISKQVYEDTDLMISIGARNESLETMTWKYPLPENCKFLQIDIDPFEIGRTWPPDLAIVGDAKLILNDLYKAGQSHIQKDRMKSPRIEALIKTKKDYEARIEEECAEISSPIKTQSIVRALNKIFGKNTILVNENGMQDLWSYMCPYYKVLDIGGVIPPGAQTIMGAGVVGTIGAKLTAPDKNVICTTGDGAFQMGMHEAATAVEYDAPVTWIILDNYGLGWTYFSHMQTYGRKGEGEYKNRVDFTKFAEAINCYGERVDHSSNIESALTNALNANNDGESAILDFIVDPWNPGPGFREGSNNITDEQLRELANKAKVTKNF